MKQKYYISFMLRSGVQINVADVESENTDEVHAVFSGIKKESSFLENGVIHVVNNLKGTRTDVVLGDIVAIMSEPMTQEMLN